MYKKILVPIDGSENSLKTLDHAAELASVLGSKIALFHVIAPLPSTVQRHVQVNNLVQEVQGFGQEVLEDAKKAIAKKYNLEIETDLIYGDPANEICDKAKKDQFDLIVIGSRGLSEITSIIMGSVSRRVARHAVCPVLIVR
ncbi:MAG TPA: universal stress protein [Desulfotomaculum sp.]|nr:MAG: universal stress protein UspA [Desulfotomaculum sp. BICA1-6]HBX22604.1 universal stress protein [Desulfotomaculum sp.]